MRTLLLALLLLLGGALADAKEAPLKAGKTHAFKTTKHARDWSLAIPSKYAPKRSWPLVVSSHGRGGRGAAEMRAWQGLANRHGFIVACPDMVTATNDLPQASSLPPSQEDDEVLLEIVATVREKLHVNPRAVMVTGFSGGGNPSYHSGLRHPDVFTHICTRGGNWAPQHMPSDEALRAAGRDTLQIYVFWGERDHVLILGDPPGTGQAFQAVEALEKNGYKHVKHEQIPAMGHESRAAMAAEWFAAYVDDHAKAFKAGDDVDDLLARCDEAAAKGKTRDAVRYLLKARELEEKHELRRASEAAWAKLEGAGHAACDEAQGLLEKGEADAALKLAANVARDYQGLPCAEAAAALVERAKPQAPK